MDFGTTIGLKAGIEIYMFAS